MATIDDKVVAMSFESSKFESGINSAIQSLEKLKASLKLPEAGKSLDNVADAAKRVDLSHIGRGVDAIQQKLSYFSVAALAIFANLATQAVRTGAQLVKSFTIQPMMTGYKEYSTQLNSIQTILANTQAAGATLDDVNATLKELNTYSDKTIYNFGQMARNIGTFTAAGVELKTATASIKGIANLAALSGSNAEQASTAMYQLSQAIAAGKVGLQDWNSVVNAGMGGTVFQRALAQTAEAMGTLKEGTVSLVGPMKNVEINGKAFRNSLAAKPGEESWLTSKVLTTTLKQFTGDLKNSELAAMGFNAAQIKAIQQTAKTAMYAATEVKTLSQVLDVAKETAGSGWAQTWQIIFGNFTEAKTTFTALSNTINGFINKSAEARNKVLGDWKEMGGRTVLIDSIKTAFHNLGLIVAPIKEAFRDIFPAKTGADLMYLTQQFESFAAKLKPSQKTVENLHRTFAGIFAVFSIGWQVVKGIFTVFSELFGALGGGSGGFLSLTASIGDFFVAIDKALKKGDRLHNFFASLGKIIAAPIALLGKFAGVLGDLFGGFSSGGISKELGGISEAMSPLQVVVESLASAWNKLMNGMADSIDMKSIIEGIGVAMSGIGVAIGKVFSNINFDAILAVIRTGLFGALVVMFKQFLGKGSFIDQIGKGFSKGIFENISGAFSGLNGSMKAMQQNLKAKTLKEIAIAIALLAVALLAISLIKPERLSASLGAMTVLFVELIGAMAVLDKITKGAGFLKLPVIIASLIGLAIAIDLLTLAVLAMSQLSWNELIKGLTGVGVLLGGIALVSKPLSANSAGLIKASAGMIVLGVALNILALAVRQFGSMSMEELGKGLGSIAVGLGVMVFAMNKMNVGENAVSVKSTIGLIAMAAALKILASAVSDLAKLSMEELGKGLVGISVGLAAMVIAMRNMPDNIGKNAAGLLLIAGALWIMSDAVAKMGAMSISELIKGLIGLGGALLILVKGMNAVSGSVKGALALGIVAASLALLAPALVMLGKQSWEQIIKGMVALAGTLTILGVAGLLLGPVVPALMGLGVAVALVGAGLALAGAGIFLFASGLSMLAVAGPAAVGILVAAINEFLAAVPKMAENFALALLAVVDAFAQTAPKFVEAIVKIINSLLDVIIQSAPKMATAFIALLDAALTVLRERQTQIIAAGISLLLALLNGIKQNIGQLVTVTADIIVKFLSGISTNLGKIITAGASILISLIKGIGDNLGKIVTAVFDVITKFITEVGKGILRVPAEGLKLLVAFLKGIGDNLGKIVGTAADIISKLITEIGKGANKLVTSGTNALISFIEGLTTNGLKLINAAAECLLQLLIGLRIAVQTYSPQFRDEGLKLGVAIADGMTGGLLSKAWEVGQTAWNLGKGAVKKIGEAVDSKSPSKATFAIGQFIADGLSLGIAANAPGAYAAATTLSNSVIGAFNTTFQTASPSKVMIQIGQYVGQGFAQGLRGSGEDINNAFAELNEKLTTAMKTAKETILSEQKKLDELRKASKPDAEAIATAERAIKESEALLRASTATRAALINQLDDEEKKLVALRTKYDENIQKIKEAQQALIEFKKNVTDQYSAGPSMNIDTDMTSINSARTALQAEQEKLNQLNATNAATTEEVAAQQQKLTEATNAYNTAVAGRVLTENGTAVDQLASYMEALKNQTAAVGAYDSTLKQLRQLGLDDVTYNRLLTEGTADQSFANQLLAGGRTAVQSLNTLDSNLMKVSKTLATNAAHNLKLAGGEGAEGLLKGLTKENKAIRKAMDDIIEDIVNIIKAKMKIKSPSKVMERLGGFAMLGLAKGLAKSGPVTDAVEQTARDALIKLRDSLKNNLKWATDGLNLKPVISPILDAEKMKQLRKEIEQEFGKGAIEAAASYMQASNIVRGMDRFDQSKWITESGPPEIKFEQNNYSPESLTEIEIYRQTKNQLSQLKSVLA